ncbi:MAG: bifunctional ornithine acetyltransferase/N-acetylglutamate synthase, partial [Planctomycetota bacterium]|nr:bifunctional ornithine acetyltransferase/N-acetylglutamate synthase [Planctomycetota bacterium]
AVNGELRGIVANSGCANAYTGEEGLADAREMCRLVARDLGVASRDLGVASTGVIGRHLNMKLIESLIKKASKNMRSSSAASLTAARAVMTTDRTHKTISVKTRLKTGEEVEIGGIAKGAGMIAPQLRHATMLCFLTTNAFVPKKKINEMLKEAVEQSFNVATVDGDMSTNDMVLLLANGLAKNQDVDENFQEALNFVTRELAKMLVRDAEGATKLIEIMVLNARSGEDAVKAGRAIARSNLVKAAFFGGDPNWGRIIAAAGYSGADFNPDNISLFLSDENREVCLVEKGRVLAFQGSKDLERAEKIMKSSEVIITLDLNKGEESATLYGCDMGYDYIK